MKHSQEEPDCGAAGAEGPCLDGGEEAQGQEVGAQCLRCEEVQVEAEGAGSQVAGCCTQSALVAGEEGVEQLAGQGQEGKDYREPEDVDEGVEEEAEAPGKQNLGFKVSEAAANDYAQPAGQPYEEDQNENEVIDYHELIEGEYEQHNYCKEYEEAPGDGKEAVYILLALDNYEEATTDTADQSQEEVDNRTLKLQEGKEGLNCVQLVEIELCFLLLISILILGGGFLIKYRY